MRYLKFDEIDENTPILINKLRTSESLLAVDCPERKQFLIEHYSLTEEQANRIAIVELTGSQKDLVLKMEPGRFH